MDGPLTLPKSPQKGKTPDPATEHPSYGTDDRNRLPGAILRHVDAGVRFCMLCFSVELHCAALTLVSQLVVQLVNSDPQVRSDYYYYSC